MQEMFRNNLVWEGPLFGDRSSVRFNRNICFQLIGNGLNMSIIGHGLHTPGQITEIHTQNFIAALNHTFDQPVNVHVRHLKQPDFDPPPEGYWIIMLDWRFGSLPQSWMRPLRQMVDEIWVPSSFLRECFIQSGIPKDKVSVISAGVDSRVFTSGLEPFQLKTRKNFKFLYIGRTIHQTLIESFCESFSSTEDVCLVIKDMSWQEFPKHGAVQQLISGLSEGGNVPEIEYVDEKLDGSDLARLYDACDCLLYPCDDDVYGLHIAEAMACSLPVIVSESGAALDFCHDEIAYLVPAKKMYLPENRSGGIETVDLSWRTEPDRESLIRLMKHVVTNREEAELKGRRAAQYIRAHFTWEKAAERVIERLNLLQGKPIVRYSPDIQVASNTDKDTIEELMRLGEDHFGQGDFTGAVRLFNRVLELDPKNSQALNNMGVIQWQLGETVSAIKTLQLALNINPEDADALENLLRAVTETKRIDLVKPELLKLVKQAQGENPDLLKLIYACREVKS